MYLIILKNWKQLLITLRKKIIINQKNKGWIIFEKDLKKLEKYFKFQFINKVTNKILQRIFSEEYKRF